jgi:PKHD-type hydroxylase
MVWGLFSQNDRFNSNSYASFNDIFTKEECDTIIKYGETLEKNKGEVFKVNDNYEIRNSEVSWIQVNPETEWIYRKCTDLINIANSQFFNYDLNFIEQLQFTFYDSKENSFYGKHMDSQNQYSKNMFRKLSFAIQLNDPSEYTGGDFIMHLSENSPPADKKLGMAYVFPSFILHEVTPVTSGSRYSLVGWVNGPYWR